MSDKKPQCAERVFSGGLFWPHQCSRAGVMRAIKNGQPRRKSDPPATRLTARGLISPRLRSLRAVIANDVRAAMKLAGDVEARAWIDRRSRHRREINRLRKLANQAEAARGDAAACDVLIAQMIATQEIGDA